MLKFNADELDLKEKIVQEASKKTEHLKEKENELMSI